MAALKEAVITKKYRRIAIVGLPCVAHALKRVRESNNPLLKPFQKAIRLVIGLFCTESFDYHMFVEEKLAQTYRIPPWKISRMNVKGKFDLTLSDGQTLALSLKEIEDCIRPGCHYCSDFAANDADISAGADFTGQTRSA
jgi:coenzyme F420 hydrogenase subunit beta